MLLLTYLYLIFNFFSLLFPFENTHESDCIIDQLYDKISNNTYEKLVEQRRVVRNKNKFNLNKLEKDTLTVNVVFHNVYELKDGQPYKSFCDYNQGWGNQYLTSNNQTICNERLHRALIILNEQFSKSKIKFVPHPDYSEMLQISDDGFNQINPFKINDIKEKYNIPNAINIYLGWCINIETCPEAGYWGENQEDECIANNIGCKKQTAGYSTYPWSTNNYGIAIRHESFPGMNEDNNHNWNFVLPHEIGHYFSLLHIEGTWIWSKENPQNESVNGSQCEFYGDLICDTPAQPGSASNAFYHKTINDEEKCIYYGYGGNYNIETQELQLGGYNNVALKSNEIPQETIFNWCNEWGSINNPYNQYEHCNFYTNYDKYGDFFGTKDLNPNCIETNQDVFSTKKCHENEFPFLPIATNFLQQMTIAQYCGQRGFNEYDTGEGFTQEQFDNIRYSLEYNYTGCNDITACNTDTLSSYLLNIGNGSCKYPCSESGGCYLYNNNSINNENYDCNGNLLHEQKQLTPSKISINNIYPNPFNPITNITYSINSNSMIDIKIYNVKGKLIKNLIEDFHNKGYYHLRWDASQYPSGIYFIRFYSNSKYISKKLLLIK